MRKSRHNVWRVCLLILAGWGAFGAFPAPFGGNKKDPIHIQAIGSIECDQIANKVRAVENASVRKGHSTLYGDIIYGYFQKTGGRNQLHKVEAFGNVKVILPDKVIQAKEGYYDVPTDIIILKGNVRGTDKKNQLSGEYARINRKTGVTEVFAASPDEKADEKKALESGMTEPIKSKRVRILLG